MTKSWTWKASRGCEFESNRLRADDGRVPFHFWQRQKVMEFIELAAVLRWSPAVLTKQA